MYPGNHYGYGPPPPQHPPYPPWPPNGPMSNYPMPDTRYPPPPLNYHGYGPPQVNLGIQQNQFQHPLLGQPLIKNGTPMNSNAQVCSCIGPPAFQNITSVPNLHQGAKSYGQSLSPQPANVGPFSNRNTFLQNSYAQIFLPGSSGVGQFSGNMNQSSTTNVIVAQESQLTNSGPPPSVNQNVAPKPSFSSELSHAQNAPNFCVPVMPMPVFSTVSNVAVQQRLLPTNTATTQRMVNYTNKVKSVMSNCNVNSAAAGFSSDARCPDSGSFSENKSVNRPGFGVEKNVDKTTLSSSRNIGSRRSRKMNNQSVQQEIIMPVDEKNITDSKTSNNRDNVTKYGLSIVSWLNTAVKSPDECADSSSQIQDCMEGSVCDNSHRNGTFMESVQQSIERRLLALDEDRLGRIQPLKKVGHMSKDEDLASSTTLTESSGNKSPDSYRNLDSPIAVEQGRGRGKLFQNPYWGTPGPGDSYHDDYEGSENSKQHQRPRRRRPFDNPPPIHHFHEEKSVKPTDEETLETIYRKVVSFIQAHGVVSLQGSKKMDILKSLSSVEKKYINEHGMLHNILKKCPYLGCFGSKFFVREDGLNPVRVDDDEPLSTGYDHAFPGYQGGYSDCGDIQFNDEEVDESPTTLAETKNTNTQDDFIKDLEKIQATPPRVGSFGDQCCEQFMNRADQIGIKVGEAEDDVEGTDENNNQNLVLSPIPGMYQKFLSTCLASKIKVHVEVGKEEAESCATAAEWSQGYDELYDPIEAKDDVEGEIEGTHHDALYVAEECAEDSLCKDVAIADNTVIDKDMNIPGEESCVQGDGYADDDDDQGDDEIYVSDDEDGALFAELGDEEVGVDVNQSQRTAITSKSGANEAVADGDVDISVGVRNSVEEEAAEDFAIADNTVIDKDMNIPGEESCVQGDGYADDDDDQGDDEIYVDEIYVSDDEDGALFAELGDEEVGVDVNQSQRTAITSKSGANEAVADGDVDISVGVRNSVEEEAAEDFAIADNTVIDKDMNIPGEESCVQGDGYADDDDDQGDDEIYVDEIYVSDDEDGALFAELGDEEVGVDVNQSQRTAITSKSGANEAVADGDVDISVGVRNSVEEEAAEDFAIADNTVIDKDMNIPGEESCVQGDGYADDDDDQGDDEIYVDEIYVSDDEDSALFAELGDEEVGVDVNQSQRTAITSKSGANEAVADGDVDISVGVRNSLEEEAAEDFAIADNTVIDKDMNIPGEESCVQGDGYADDDDDQGDDEIYVSDDEDGALFAELGDEEVGVDVNQSQRTAITSKSGANEAVADGDVDISVGVRNSVEEEAAEDTAMKANVEDKACKGKVPEAVKETSVESGSELFDEIAAISDAILDVGDDSKENGDTERINNILARIDDLKHAAQYLTRTPEYVFDVLENFKDFIVEAEACGDLTSELQRLLLLKETIFAATKQTSDDQSEQKVPSNIQLEKKLPDIGVSTKKTAFKADSPVFVPGKQSPTDLKVNISKTTLLKIDSPVFVPGNPITPPADIVTKFNLESPELVPQAVSSSLTKDFTPFSESLQKSTSLPFVVEKPVSTPAQVHLPGPQIRSGPPPFPVPVSIPQIGSGTQVAPGPQLAQGPHMIPRPQMGPGPQLASIPQMGPWRLSCSVPGCVPVQWPGPATSPQVPVHLSPVPGQDKKPQLSRSNSSPSPMPMNKERKSYKAHLRSGEAAAKALSDKSLDIQSRWVSSVLIEAKSLASRPSSASLHVPMSVTKEPVTALRHSLAAATGESSSSRSLSDSDLLAIYSRRTPRCTRRNSECQTDSRDTQDACVATHRIKIKEVSTQTVAPVMCDVMVNTINNETNATHPKMKDKAVSTRIMAENLTSSKSTQTKIKMVSSTLYGKALARALMAEERVLELEAGKCISDLTRAKCNASIMYQQEQTMLCLSPDEKSSMDKSHQKVLSGFDHEMVRIQNIHFANLQSLRAGAALANLLPIMVVPIDRPDQLKEPTEPLVTLPEAAQITSLEAAQITSLEAAQITSLEAAQITPVEAARVTPVEAAQVTPVEAAQITSLEAAQITPVEAAQITPVEAAQITPVEAAQIHPVEAAQIHPVEAAQITPVEAAQITPVEAAQITPVESAQIHPVEAAQITPVETAQITPVETPQISPVEAAQITQVKTALITPVEAAETTPVETAQITPVEAAQITPVDAAQIAPVEASQRASLVASPVTEMEKPKLTRPPGLNTLPEPLAENEMAEMEKYVTGSMLSAPAAPSATTSGVDPVILQQLVTMQILQQYPMLVNEPQLLQTFVFQQMSAIMQMQHDLEIQASAPVTFGAQASGSTTVNIQACTFVPQDTEARSTSSAPEEFPKKSDAALSDPSRSNLEWIPKQSRQRNERNVMENSWEDTLTRPDSKTFNQKYSTRYKSLETVAVSSESLGRKSHSLESSRPLSSVHSTTSRVSDGQQKLVSSLVKRGNASFRSGFYSAKAAHSQPASDSGNSTFSSRSSAELSSSLARRNSGDESDLKPKHSKQDLSRAAPSRYECGKSARGSSNSPAQSSQGPPSSYGYAFQPSENWDEDLGYVNIPTFSSVNCSGRFKAKSVSQVLDEAVEVGISKVDTKLPKTRGRRGRKNRTTTREDVVASQMSLNSFDGNKTSSVTTSVTSAPQTTWDAFDDVQKPLSESTSTLTPAPPPSCWNNLGFIKKTSSNSSSMTTSGFNIVTQTPSEFTSMNSSKYKASALDSFGKNEDPFQPKFKPPESFMPASDPKTPTRTEPVLTAVTPEKQEEEWQEMTKKRRGNESTNREVSAASKSSKTKKDSTGAKKAESGKTNNFERLVTTLLKALPDVSRDGVIGLVQEVRTNHGGLQGLTLHDIIEEAIEFSKQTDSNQPFNYASAIKIKSAAKTDPNETNTLTSLGKFPSKQKTKPAIVHPSVLAQAPPRPLAATLNSLQDDDDDLDNMCVICHDSLKSFSIKTLDCGHTYHDMCIKKWVYSVERTCPTCRSHALFPEEFPRLA